MTLKPKALARSATAEPMRPRPTMPSVSPRMRAQPVAASRTCSGPATPGNTEPTLSSAHSPRGRINTRYHRHRHAPNVKRSYTMREIDRDILPLIEGYRFYQ
ncbi:uncharacterized protein LOC114361458, partial [Ostrinia furnacalis]|uniref:uncharacterized protein LOC114361458 n=1 Tax=Ostrinia furnacalis TaxID=93504 RepID=UPI00103CFE50